MVWCITVPHGAFIARRNGLIFATGNSGFPKSLDVSKAIDKAAGAEREVIGDKLDRPGYHLNGHNGGEAFGHGIASTTPETRLAAALITAPATDAAREWSGWGTALKPSFEGIVCATKPVPALAGGSRAAFEPVVVARKPLIGTVAANVLAHGTGALNIDGCRIEHGGNIANADGGGQGAGYEAHNKPARIYGKGLGGIVAEPHTSGRWPANVVLDESQAGALDEQSGTQRDGVAVKRNGRTEAEGWGNIGKAAVGTPDETYGGQAGASRFFYVAKADASERPRANGTAHPTVKPLDLMRWLVRLVTPPGGIVLEPFAGSGTTVEACIKEDVRCVAIEREADYLPLIDERINRNNLSLFAGGAS